MCQLESYEIPFKIQDLEYRNKREYFNDYAGAIDEVRTCDRAYDIVFTFLLHMEEAASSTSVRKFNLNSVRPQMHSYHGYIFKVKFQVR